MAPKRPATPAAPVLPPLTSTQFSAPAVPAAPPAAVVVEPVAPAPQDEQRIAAGVDAAVSEIRLPDVEVPEVDLPTIVEPAAPALDVAEPMIVPSEAATHIAEPCISDAPPFVDRVDEPAAERADDVPMAMEAMPQDDVTLPGLPTSAARFDVGEIPPALVVAPTVGEANQVEEGSPMEAPHASAPAPVFDPTDDVAPAVVQDGELPGDPVPDEDVTLVAAPTPVGPAR